MKWIFILLAMASVIVNICVGGLLWFPVALMGLFMVWNLVLSIDLVEYNRISQFIKATIYSCILMALIDIFLVSGWALDVISIVSFASVIISGILFFTDFNRQKQNMLPMFYLITIALIWSMVGLFSALEVMSWPLIVLGGVTLLLLAVIIITLRGDFIRELKCRFHLK
jgi:hypothetical protein